MAEPTSTLTNAVKLAGLTRILLTPYTGDAKGSTTYSLDNIIGDTCEITQEDNETNTIDCETRDEPVFENITLGAKTFAAESGDIQESILVNCLGYTKDTTNKNLYAPVKYKELWAEVELVFGEKGSLVAPKVKISGHVQASSLKTDMVRGIISGTLYSVEMMDGDGETKIQTNLYFKAPAGE